MQASLLFRSILTIVAVTLSAPPVFGQTLDSAVAAAMRHYPPILADSYRRQAAQAGIGVARAGWYPRVTATGDVGAASGDRGLSAGSGGSSLGGAGSPFGADWTTRWGYALMAEQGIYDGGRTRNAVAEAEAGTAAADAQVRLTEQLVVLEAVTVFADLARDREIEDLRGRGVAMLAEQVQAMQSRHARGDVSATDVAQTRARHAQALAELITAKANVAGRIAEYVRVIGQSPGKLGRAPLPGMRTLTSAEATVASAVTHHPMAFLAGHKEEASRFATERLRADGRPQVKLRGGVEGDHAFGSSGLSRDAASASVRVTVPLFDGGETASRVDQAYQLNKSLAEDARGVRDRLHAGAVTAWSGLEAAKQRVDVERAAAADYLRAVDGLREEVRLGQRSQIDLLDAQRELVASQVRVANADRDLVVAAYSLLSSAGLLTPIATTGKIEAQQLRAPHLGWEVKSVKSSKGRPQEAIGK